MNTFINIFDSGFIKLHKRSCETIKRTPPEKLFWKPIESYKVFSCGENILRSAGKVEQSFGGIMTRLWDDPFEWTLPEELSSNEKILDYLLEVEQTRKNGFAFLSNDEDLKKKLQTPDGMKNLFEILLETLTKAENLQGRAFSIFQMYSHVK